MVQVARASSMAFYFKPLGGTRHVDGVSQGSAESAVREISGSEIGEMLNLVMLVHLSTSGA